MRGYQRDIIVEEGGGRGGAVRELTKKWRRQQQHGKFRRRKTKQIILRSIIHTKISKNPRDTCLYDEMKKKYQVHTCVQYFINLRNIVPYDRSHKVPHTCGTPPEQIFLTRVRHDGVFHNEEREHLHQRQRVRLIRWTLSKSSASLSVSVYLCRFLSLRLPLSMYLSLFLPSSVSVVLSPSLSRLTR